MRIVRFIYNSKTVWGLAGKTNVRVLSEPPFKRLRFSGKTLAYDKLKFLSCAAPQKIILAGLNYIDHAKELGMKIPREPVIFMKPPTSLIGCNEKIVYPEGVRRLDYEAELACVIKKEAYRISESKISRYILGYTCLNDVTARDIQKKDIQWTRAKSFNTFCPLGPWIETCVDPSNLRISSYLNGKLKQDSTTANFIFPVNVLVSFISGIMTLYPGDVISTGTPPGVGAMKPSDVVEVEIESIGRLKNTVVQQNKDRRRLYV